MACLLLTGALAALGNEAAKPMASARAQLVAADGTVLGALLGHAPGLNERAEQVSAYTILSPQGYLADFLPSGQLSGMPALVFATPGCTGTPFIQAAAKPGNPVAVPGQVFRFGTTTGAYVVPSGMGTRGLTTGSVLRWTADGANCLDDAMQTTVYPLLVNDEKQTGLREGYAGPLRIEMIQPESRQPQPPGKAEPKPDFAAAPFDVPPDTPECAPGCFMPYLGDGVCEQECASSLCGFDRGDCPEDLVARARDEEATLCAPACKASDLGDGFCDGRCNVSACTFDQGDCAKPQ